MTKLVYAARNFLVQHPSVTSLLGVDELGDPMIYANKPEATIENTGTSMIVLVSENGWGANSHNTARFPVLRVDIWTDPTRNPDNSVRRKDADLKMEKVYEAVDSLLHRVSNSEPGGKSVRWGTATELASGGGLRIISSSRNNEPEIRPAFDDEGAIIAQIRYDICI